MKYRFWTNVFALLFFCVQFVWSQPGNYTIEVGSFYYSPSELLEIEVGSTVTWVNLGGFHNVTEAIVAVKWSYASGNIETGVFRQYKRANA